MSVGFDHCYQSEIAELEDAIYEVAKDDPQVYAAFIMALGSRDRMRELCDDAYAREQAREARLSEERE